MNPFMLLDFHLPHRFVRNDGGLVEEKYFDQQQGQQQSSMEIPNQQQKNSPSCDNSTTSPKKQNQYDELVFNKQEDEIGTITERDLEVLNCYYNSSTFLHVISRQELERFLISSTDSSIQNQEMREMMTLFDSIKAMCEMHLGRTDECEILGQKVKENLANFQDCTTNVAVAGTYLNMCLFELWNDRFEMAKLYFNKLISFKPYIESPASDEIEYKLLRDDINTSVKLLEFSIFNTDVNNLHQMLFERFLVNLPKLFQFYRNGQSLSKEWAQILKNPHLIDASNCIQIHLLILTLLRDCKKFEEDSKGRSDRLTLLYDFMESGVTMAILSKCSEKTAMIEYTIESSAKRIFKSISNPHFEQVPFEVVLYISFAAEYHYNKIQQGVLCRDCMNYLEMLQAELNAYKSLQSRFKIARFYYYGGIFQKVDSYFSNKMLP